MMDIKKMLVAALCVMPAVGFSMDQDVAPDEHYNNAMAQHQPAVTEQSIRDDLADAKQRCGIVLHNFISERGDDINAVDPTGALFEEIFNDVQLALTQECALHNDYMPQ